MDIENPVTKAEKYHAMVMTRMVEVGLESCAEAISVDKSTVSRVKDHLPKLCRMLEFLGLKIVSADRVCVVESQFLELTRIASRAMANEETARKLFFEDAE